MSSPGRSELRSTTGLSSRHTTGSAGSSGRAYSRRTSSIRSTNSPSMAGTHHIFFPPRLEVVVGEDDSDGFATDAVHDLACDRLLGGQAHGPSCPAVGRRTADHRDDRRLLL